MASILDRILGGIGQFSPATQEQAREIIGAVGNQQKETVKLMAKVGELLVAIQDVKDKIAAETAQIAGILQSLKDQIAGGGTIKESDLDPALAGLKSLVTAVEGISDGADTAGTPGNTP